MVFLLSNQNVIQYLSDRQLCDHSFINTNINPDFIESKSSKNFNLLIRLSDQNSLLVKQEPHDRWGLTKGDLLNEWLIDSSIRNCSGLCHLQSLISDPIYFDATHSILVFNYLTDYHDLDNFYATHRVYPTAIAAALGVTLSEIHRATLNRDDFRDDVRQLLTQMGVNKHLDDPSIGRVPDFGHGLDSLEPEIFGKISAEGLKFYELYQRYDSLRGAIANLNKLYTPCCLIHRDLKFNNILLHNNWQQRLTPPPASLADLLPRAMDKAGLIRLIDWEKWVWGDPAVDLGALVASYLKIWLRSLTVRASLSIDTALRLAGTPLESLQPSLRALVQAYLAHAPEISALMPNFVQRVMQFAGLDLIESVQTRLQYQDPFGNIEICMLQVAKTLLCAPEQAISTVFGVTEADLEDVSGAIALDNCLPLPKSDEWVASAELSPWVKPDSDWSRPLSQNAMLEDLVCHIQIHADGTIAHPHYPPAEEPDGLRDRLHQLPADLQRFYQHIQLRNYLYDIYFSGELQPLGVTDEAAERLENNTLRGVHVQFYNQLHQANQGKGYFDPDWRVVRQQRRHLTVQKGGLTLQIQPHRHLKPEERSPLVGDTVAVRLPPNAVEPGFYVAVGNAGLIPEESAAVEVCFNLDPTGAIALVQRLTEALNALNLPFVLKVLSDPDRYDRYDAGVLQIERHHYAVVQPVLQTLYLQERSHFGEAVPLLMKPLAPGIGLAEEPHTDPDDFGLNRCHWIAAALLAAEDAGKPSPEVRLKAIQHHFEQAGIDFRQQPYLNPDSEDIYTPLNAQPQN